MENDKQENGNMSQENNHKNFINWIPIIELAVLAFTTLGTTITLFLYSDSKMDEFRKETLILHREMFQESRDFHSRLEKQDAELKNHLIYEHGRDRK